MTAPIAELRQRLTLAISEVSLAESALEAALDTLNARPRAEKVTVTAVVTDAFTRLRSAHAELEKLRELVEHD